MKKIFVRTDTFKYKLHTIYTLVMAKLKRIRNRLKY